MFQMETITVPPMIGWGAAVTDATAHPPTTTMAPWVQPDPLGTDAGEVAMWSFASTAILAVCGLLGLGIRLWARRGREGRRQQQGDPEAAHPCEVVPEVVRPQRARHWGGPPRRQGE